MTAARMLMLLPLPREAAYTRYRALQFLPDLAAAGIHTDVAPFLTSAEYRGYYDTGAITGKALRLAVAVVRRLREAARAAAYDVVFIGREALLFGPPWIERFIGGVLDRRLVFDFDDAIFLPNPNTAWGRWSGLAARFKCPRKTDAILAVSDRVLAGNNFLAEHARAHSERVTVLPTVVDPDDYPDASDRSECDLPVVGWVGTHTTAAYLASIAPALKEVAGRRPFRLRLVGAGDGILLADVPVESLPWRLETEFSVFAGMDVGLYPLPDTPWARGKCGFKAIQYLASGVPAVCSPVGVTTEIVEEGRTGFLARTHEEWVTALERLIEDAHLRRAMGARGRELVRERWSRQVHAPRLVGAIRDVLAQPRAALRPGLHRTEGVQG